MIEWPRAGGMVEVGDRVRDRKHPIETGTVLAVSDVPATDYYVETLDTTVFADNPDYPPDDPVVEVVWNVLGNDDLAAARAEHTVYHFPLSRLVCEEYVRVVAPETLRPSPYHMRSFALDENRNRGYVSNVRSQRYIESVLVARETAAGFELVAGHKRRWVALQASLNWVTVRVVDLTDWEAALHYAQDHLGAVDDATARRTIRVLAERWGDRVGEIPAVQTARRASVGWPMGSGGQSTLTAIESK